MTSPFRNSLKAAILLAAYTGQEKKTSGRKRTTTTRIIWTRGHLNGTTPRDTTTRHIPKNWTENFYETDEYDANDSTLSLHFLALLDQPVETQEGDASKLETTQEAVAAANAILCASVVVIESLRALQQTNLPA